MLLICVIDQDDPDKRTKWRAAYEANIDYVLVPEPELPGHVTYKRLSNGEQRAGTYADVMALILGEVSDV